MLGPRVCGSSQSCVRNIDETVNEGPSERIKSLFSHNCLFVCFQTHISTHPMHSLSAMQFPDAITAGNARWLPCGHLQPVMLCSTWQNLLQKCATALKNIYFGETGQCSVIPKRFHPEAGNAK